MFVTPRGAPSVTEGQDFLFRCLLTDPSVTELTLQSAESKAGEGRGLPRGMNVTFDRKKGALIRDPQRSFSGKYVCSGWKDRREFRSRPVTLQVFPSKTRLSASWSLPVSR